MSSPTSTLSLSTLTQVGGSAGSPLLDLINLDHNADALLVEMDELRAEREGLAEEALHTPTDSVRAWMDSVDSLTRQVAVFREALDRIGTGCFCLFSCHSYKLARVAAGHLRSARALRSEARELGGVPMVGREGELSIVRGLLGDDLTLFIRIVGVAGVGKTALLRKVRDEALAVGLDRKFDAVVWVTVTRNPDYEKIRGDVRAQLGLPPSTPALGSRSIREAVCEGARRLYMALARRRCLFLLDDVWGHLDVGAIGIPVHECACKIVYTSRSSDGYSGACGRSEVKVSFLDKEESWALFRATVGADSIDPAAVINPVARQIVDKCGGLPLALVTVGRAVADANTVDVWQDALVRLTDSPLDFPGMQGLRCALDVLHPSSRDCLEYCSLFPEGHYIPTEQLVDYWVGEFLETGLAPWVAVGDDPLPPARKLGHSEIEHFEAAGLLERSAGGDGGMHVKMHVLIRRVALWHTAKSNGFVVMAGGELTCVPSGVLCKDAVRVSLMDNEIRDLPDSPDCPNLFTLFLNKNTRLYHIPDTFFHLMPVLRVLDLSDTRIEELPDGVGLLTQLRYLNLSHTALRSLPMGFGNLKRLEQLELGYTRQLVTIPQAAIVTLGRLRKLNLRNSAYCWTPESKEHGERGLGFKDLGLLDGLKDLRLDVESSPVLVEILSSNRLSRSVTDLTLQHVGNLSHLPPNFNALSNLRELCLYECFGLEELTFSRAQFLCLKELSLVGLSITTIVIQKTALLSLCNLRVFGCHRLRDITGILRVNSSLECIDLRVCNGLEVLMLPREYDDLWFDK